MSIFFVAFALLISAPTASATTLGFFTQSLSAEDKSEAMQKLDLELIYEDDYQAGIQCFDVSPDGLVALAFQSGSKGWVYVYNQDNAFQYGFTFVADGDFGIEFYQEFLALYFIRGNRIAIYDSSGNCVDILDENPPNQNIGRTKEILNRTQKELSGKRYILERDVALGDSYSRCVTINQQGARTEIYDVSTKHSTEEIARLIAFVCFFAFVIWGAYNKHKKAEE